MTGFTATKTVMGRTWICGWDISYSSPIINWDNWIVFVFVIYACVSSSQHYTVVISSAIWHSDVQYVESLWTIRHYVMKPVICLSCLFIPSGLVISGGEVTKLWLLLSSVNVMQYQCRNQLTPFYIYQHSNDTLCPTLRLDMMSLPFEGIFQACYR